MSNKRCLGVARLVSVANGRWSLIGTAHYARLEVSNKKEEKKRVSLLFRRKHHVSTLAPVSVSDLLIHTVNTHPTENDKCRKDGNKAIVKTRNTFVTPLSEDRQTNVGYIWIYGFRTNWSLSCPERTVKP